jgi:hypothetical protein
MDDCDSRTKKNPWAGLGDRVKGLILGAGGDILARK